MDKDTLIAANVDYENGIKRFAGNATLYEKYLLKFKDDVHYEAAKAAYEAGDFDTLLKEAHTLKGVAGTLGLTDIYQTCANIVIALRGERTEQIPQLFRLLQHAYEKTMNVVR